MNRSQGPVSTLTLGIAALFLLIVLHAIGILRPVEALVGFVLKPLTSLVNIGGSSDVEKENEELRTKVEQLTSEVSNREEAKKQNDSLRSQLGFAQSGGYALAHANIISQDPSNYQQFFTIDRGGSSGINKGMAVVSNGLLVGKIIDTTATTAKVYLITDYNSAVPTLAQATRATGVIRGQRGFGLQLTMVAQTDQLQAGDTILTSGFGGDYPKGLVIGTVGEIQQRDSEVFQTAVIRPAVDFRKLESVFVITGNK